QPRFALPCVLIGITPACAGSTFPGSERLILFRDHTRLRGEYSRKPEKPLFSLGSPPLARGVLRETVRSEFFPGITPACAGSTLCRSSHPARCRDHPRLRGEYSNIFDAMTVVGGSP